jgi:hypothetical protein
MPQYLVAVYRPDDYDPSVETEVREILFRPAPTGATE